MYEIILAFQRRNFHETCSQDRGSRLDTCHAVGFIGRFFPESRVASTLVSLPIWQMIQSGELPLSRCWCDSSSCNQCCDISGANQLLCRFNQVPVTLYWKYTSLRHWSRHMHSMMKKCRREYHGKWNRATLTTLTSYSLLRLLPEADNTFSCSTSEPIILCEVPSRAPEHCTLPIALFLVGCLGKNGAKEIVSCWLLGQEWCVQRH